MDHITFLFDKKWNATHFCDHRTLPHALLATSYTLLVTSPTPNQPRKHKEAFSSFNLKLGSSALPDLPRQIPPTIA
jgi:hypothetical protein